LIKEGVDHLSPSYVDTMQMKICANGPALLRSHHDSIEGGTLNSHQLTRICSTCVVQLHFNANVCQPLFGSTNEHVSEAKAALLCSCAEYLIGIWLVHVTHSPLDLPSQQVCKEVFTLFGGFRVDRIGPE
jgi:hypothetical protein